MARVFNSDLRERETGPRLLILLLAIAHVGPVGGGQVAAKLNFLRAHNISLDLNAVPTAHQVRWSTDHSRLVHLQAAISHIPTHIAEEGFYLEFGVREALMLRALTRELPPTRRWHGFDSFVGLPSDARGATWRPGQYTTKGHLPDMSCCPNVVLHAGWFNETLPAFLDRAPANNNSRGNRQHHPRPIAFMHLDADIYSSTVLVLDAVFGRCRHRVGSVLAFDELWGTQAQLEHEWRALHESTSRHGVRWEFISYALTPKSPYGRAAVQIVDAGPNCTGRRAGARSASRAASSSSPQAATSPSGGTPNVTPAASSASIFEPLAPSHIEPIPGRRLSSGTNATTDLPDAGERFARTGGPPIACPAERVVIANASAPAECAQRLLEGLLYMSGAGRAGWRLEAVATLRRMQLGFVNQPIPDHTRVGVLHLHRGPWAKDNYGHVVHHEPLSTSVRWLYRVPPALTGVWYDVGRSLVFREHAEANAYFNATAEECDVPRCKDEFFKHDVLPQTFARARHAGWDSLQFVRHTTDHDRHARVELVDLQLPYAATHNRTACAAALAREQQQRLHPNAEPIATVTPGEAEVLLPRYFCGRNEARKPCRVRCGAWLRCRDVEE